MRWVEDDLCDFCADAQVQIYSEGDMNLYLRAAR